MFCFYKPGEKEMLPSVNTVTGTLQGLNKWTLSGKKRKELMWKTSSEQKLIAEQDSERNPGWFSHPKSTVSVTSPPDIDRGGKVYDGGKMKNCSTGADPKTAKGAPQGSRELWPGKKDTFRNIKVESFLKVEATCWSVGQRSASDFCLRCICWHCEENFSSFRGF